MRQRQQDQDFNEAPESRVRLDMGEECTSKAKPVFCTLANTAIPCTPFSRLMVTAVW